MSRFPLAKHGALTFRRSCVPAGHPKRSLQPDVPMVVQKRISKNEHDYGDTIHYIDTMGYYGILWGYYSLHRYYGILWGYKDIWTQPWRSGLLFPQMPEVTIGGDHTDPPRDTWQQDSHILTLVHTWKFQLCWYVCVCVCVCIYIYIFNL